MDPRAPEKLLAAARDDLDWGIAWCCVREGMHPEQIRRLGPMNLDREGWLQWIRVKNAEPRRTLVDLRDRERLTRFLALDKPSVVTIWKRMVALTRRAGFDGGPRVLRKTYILNELRRLKDHPDKIDLVALRAGCSRKTLLQFYLDLDQWEQAYVVTDAPHA
jgi:hypothetical protein